MVVNWRHRTVVCMAFLGLPRIIKHRNQKSPLNGHLSGKIICEYMFFFFPLQCLMNYQGIQFAISPSGGGFACSNVFHPTIPLNGCIYILVILPWTSMPNYPIRWFPRLTGLHFRGVFCGIPWFSPQRPKILEDPLSFGFNGHPARCSSQKAMVERPCCLAAMWQVMDICQKNDETKGWCRYGSKIE